MPTKLKDREIHSFLKMSEETEEQSPEQSALFDNKDARKYSSILLEDWLLVLATKNSKAVKEPSTFKDFALHGKAVELVFNLCEDLKQPLEVKYTALEIFDRFMVKHVTDLYAEVTDETRRKGRLLRWPEVEGRIETQLVLRVVSCIQLASKLFSHYKALQPRKAKGILHKFGYSYSFDSILNSELRVLKTLGYRVDYTTPLTYMETLLEILAHNDPNLDPSVLYGVGIRLIDFTYIFRHTIYQRLYVLATGDRQVITPIVEHRKEYRALKNDYLLLTTAIIAASAHFVRSDLAQQVTDQLNLVTWVPVEDIRDFSYILVSSVTDDMKPLG